MKRWLLGLLVLPFIFAVPANAAVNYGWEDGVGTIIGQWGNIGSATNVGTTVHTGTRALELTEAPLGGTPQGYVARVCNLFDGQIITASFWGYDTTPGSSPSMRIWGHYDDNCTALLYKGSASGNFTYTGAAPWSRVDYTWVVDTQLGARTSLTIEARLYSPTAGPGMTGYIDDLKVSGPAGAVIEFPGGTSATEETSWGSVKNLFR